MALEDVHLAVEEVLAAAIEAHGGRVEISAESFSRGFNGKVIAMDYDMKKDVVVLTLVDQEDVSYGD